MPIHEYVCRECGAEFEELVFSGAPRPACPKCGSEETERLMSVCASRVDGGGPDLEALRSAGCGSGGG